MSLPGEAAGPVEIRPATPEDVDLLLTLIRELAGYERLEHEVLATAEDLRHHLFGETPAAQALVACVAGDAVGLALYFFSFSTFRGRPGLYLEDLFVRPEHRGRGVGRALLGQLAEIAVTRGCARMEWSVLDWNASAIGFYRSLGARPMDDWTVYRLDDEALLRLAHRPG